MTIIRGVRIMASPCCGAQYSFPRYVSMNFMAFEYWTDGWRDGSLMPNDEGLRRCKCGQYLLVRDMVAVDTADASELPYMDWVPDEQLPECIAQAGSDEIEVAARLGYWRHLNHPYRERYRQHRDVKRQPPRRHGRLPTPIAETGGTSCVAGKRQFTAGRQEVPSRTLYSKPRTNNVKTCCV